MGNKIGNTTLFAVDFHNRINNLPKLLVPTFSLQNNCIRKIILMTSFESLHYYSIINYIIVVCYEFVRFYLHHTLKNLRVKHYVFLFKRIPETRFPLTSSCIVAVIYIYGRVPSRPHEIMKPLVDSQRIADNTLVYCL